MKRVPDLQLKKTNFSSKTKENQCFLITVIKVGMYILTHSGHFLRKFANFELWGTFLVKIWSVKAVFNPHFSPIYTKNKKIWHLHRKPLLKLN